MQRSGSLPAVFRVILSDLESAKGDIVDDSREWMAKERRESNREEDNFFFGVSVRRRGPFELSTNERGKRSPIERVKSKLAQRLRCRLKEMAKVSDRGRALERKRRARLALR